MGTAGQLHHFTFVGGPLDGTTRALADEGDGYPNLFVVPWTHESMKGCCVDDAPPDVGEYRYERVGSTYRYLEEAE